MAVRLCVYCVALAMSWFIFAGQFFKMLTRPGLILATIRSILSPRQPDEEPGVLQDPRYGKHRYIDANGIRFHVVQRGKGRLMLFLHGFPDSWYAWRHQIPVFAQHYTVVAVDMRGYGRTDKPASLRDYSLDTLVDDVRCLITQLGFESCTLVAHDWGAAIAWSFAYRYAAMLDALVIMNVPHPKGWRNAGFRQLLRSWYILFFQLPVLPELLLWLGDYAAIGEMLTGARMGLVNQHRVTPDDIEVSKWTMAQPGTLTAAINYYRNLMYPTKLRTSGVLSVPTLMIWVRARSLRGASRRLTDGAPQGEQDAALGMELTAGTAKWVDQLKFVPIPTASHWVQTDEPELVNAEMKAFLRL